MDTLKVQLIKAVSSGDIATTVALLQNIDPNFTEDRDGITPLHFAAAHGSEEVAKALITAGADVRAVNADSQTPLDIAKLHKHEKLIELLIASSMFGIQISSNQLKT